MTNKKTNKELFTEVLAVIASASITDTEKTELSDFINGRIEQLEKKANTVSKADKAKAELNTKIANDILAGLNAIGEPVRISDLIKKYEPLNDFSTQKLSPIIVKLVNEGRVEKIASKRTVLYALPNIVIV